MESREGIKISRAIPVTRKRSRKGKGMEKMKNRGGVGEREEREVE